MYAVHKRRSNNGSDQNRKQFWLFSMSYAYTDLMSGVSTEFVIDSFCKPVYVFLVWCNFHLPNVVGGACMWCTQSEAKLVLIRIENSSDLVSRSYAYTDLTSGVSIEKNMDLFNRPGCVFACLFIYSMLLAAYVCGAHNAKQSWFWSEPKAALIIFYEQCIYRVDIGRTNWNNLLICLVG